MAIAVVVMLLFPFVYHGCNYFHEKNRDPWQLKAEGKFQEVEYIEKPKNVVFDSRYPITVVHFADGRSFPIYGGRRAEDIKPGTKIRIFVDDEFGLYKIEPVPAR